MVSLWTILKYLTNIMIAPNDYWKFCRTYMAKSMFRSILIFFSLKSSHDTTIENLKLESFKIKRKFVFYWLNIFSWSFLLILYFCILNICEFFLHIMLKYTLHIVQSISRLFYTSYEFYRRVYNFVGTTMSHPPHHQNHKNP